MSKTKVFNGKFVHEYLAQNPRVWKALCDILWSEKSQQKKSYFEKKTEVASSTLWALHEVTGLPWEYFFTGEGDPEINPKTVDQHLDIHHNTIHTLNANSNPEVLLAYLDMSKQLNNEKDKRIAELQTNNRMLRASVDELLRRNSNVKMVQECQET